MGHPLAKHSISTYDPTELLPKVRIAAIPPTRRNDPSEEFRRVGKNFEVYVTKARRGYEQDRDRNSDAFATERRRGPSDRRRASTMVEDNVYSALWPTVSFSVGLVAVLFAYIFLSQGQLSHFVTAAFVAFVFVSLSYVSMRLRRQVKRAWRESLTTD